MCHIKMLFCCFCITERPNEICVSLSDKCPNNYSAAGVRTLNTAASCSATGWSSSFQVFSSVWIKRKENGRMCQIIIYSLYTFNIWENLLHNVRASRSLCLPASWTKAPTHRICAPREAERMRWQRYKDCHGEDDHLGTTTVALWLHKGWHLYCFSLIHWKMITWHVCIHSCMFPQNRSLSVFYFI